MYTVEKLLQQLCVNQLCRCARACIKPKLRTNGSRTMPAQIATKNTTELSRSFITSPRNLHHVGWFGADWGHPNARWHLWQLEASEGFHPGCGSAFDGSFGCGSAEFQVPRSLDATLVASHPCGKLRPKVSTADNAPITDGRRGRQLGPISFSASTRNCGKADFDGLSVAPKVRGLQRRTSRPRRNRAFPGVSGFPPSLHLLAWKQGAWPSRMPGMQADVRLAWLMNYLFSFAVQLPLERLPPRPSSSHKSSAPSEKARGRRGGAVA